MAFTMLSPGVNVTEYDATNIIPAVATTAGGFAGTFQWGPVLQITTVDSETTLVNVFEGPNDNTAVSFFTAANFLGYGNNLQVVRVVGSTALNAVASGQAVLIENLDTYNAEYINGTGQVGIAAAKYPGILGNALKVSIANAAAYSQNLNGTFTTTQGSAEVAGVSTTFDTQVTPGSFLYTSAGILIGQVASVTSATALILKQAVGALGVVTAGTGRIDWEFKSSFSGAPNTSDWVANVSGLNDEIHVAVVDVTGAFSGTPNTVLETYPYVSVANDAKKDDGSTNYYKSLLNGSSQYVWWMGHPIQGTNWGNPSAGNSFAQLTQPVTAQLMGGISDDVATDQNLTNGYNMFVNAELVNVSLIPAGGGSSVVQQFIIENVAEIRKDCVAFVSPLLSDVVNNVGQEVNSITATRNMLPSSSYAVMDTGWKYQYDRYNDVYRWIPLNGDIAGLCARTDMTNDPWWSPAGFNRGQINNVIKLAYSPGQTDRDLLYPIGVNPVVTFNGQGTVLYGDKTLLSKPSSFDRINVRRLFIVLEKAIAVASQYQLFEFNDSFTQAQFKAFVEPYLRDVQGRRGIQDFLVVCDSTNNTADVIDANQFEASIYIKPARSINFIQLQFISTPTGAQFSEIVGIAG
jgi:hypothetical protein